MTSHEKRRQELQARLDEPKTSLERNRLGQFATPIELANDMLSYARDLLSTEKKRSLSRSRLWNRSLLFSFVGQFPSESNHGIRGLRD